MYMPHAPLPSQPSLSPSQVADLRLAASNMTGPTRRAFEAEMTLKYCGGTPLMAEVVFGLTITHIDCLSVWPHANPRPATSSHVGHATRSVRQASRPSDD
jgi:hypothetical protein